MAIVQLDVSEISMLRGDHDTPHASSASVVAL
jgi:hypothetical protein